MCLLILALAKCSLLALILRIIGTNSGRSRLFCMGLIVLSAVWGIGSIVGILVNCRSETLLTLDHGKGCPSQVRQFTPGLQPSPLLLDRGY